MSVYWNGSAGGSGVPRVLARLLGLVFAGLGGQHRLVGDRLEDVGVDQVAELLAREDQEIDLGEVVGRAGPAARGS